MLIAIDRVRLVLPLNRNLRPRIRKLPEPPHITEQLPENPKPKIEVLSDSSFESDEQFATVLEGKIENIEISAQEREEFLAARKNLLDELDGIFRQGFDGTLSPPTENNKKINVDYTSVKRKNYERAIADYEAAGKTLSDSGLYSNASISFGCVILAKFLATNSLSSAYDEFQRIIENIQHKQIIRSSFFSILTQIFESIAIKDNKGILRQLEKLKLIETFSTDDQQLIGDSIDALTKLFSK